MCRAGKDRVMDVASHVIGNYTIQDLFVAGGLLRKAARQHAQLVSTP